MSTSGSSEGSFVKSLSLHLSWVTLDLTPQSESNNLSVKIEVHEPGGKDDILSDECRWERGTIQNKLGPSFKPRTSSKRELLTVV